MFFAEARMGWKRQWRTAASPSAVRSKMQSRDSRISSPCSREVSRLERLADRPRAERENIIGLQPRTHIGVSFKFNSLRL
jgi:hypothetical protein